jgi:hypothetical protein
LRNRKWINCFQLLDSSGAPVCPHGAKTMKQGENPRLKKQRKEPEERNRASGDSM